MQMELFDAPERHDDRIETSDYRYSVKNRVLIVTHKRSQTVHKLHLRGVIYKNLNDTIKQRLTNALTAKKPTLPKIFFESFMTHAQLQHEHQQL